MEGSAIILIVSVVGIVATTGIIVTVVVTQTDGNCHINTI